MGLTPEEPEVRPAWIVLDDPLPGRACRSCNLCCVLLPVRAPDLDKDAGVRCRHLFGKGCRIYTARPRPCRVWSCRWLFDPAMQGMRRPDHAGYVVDGSLDTVIADGRAVDAVQVWIEPHRPDAHRDPALRRYLDEVGARFGLLSIIRFSSMDSFVLVPPSLTKSGDWIQTPRGVGSVPEAELQERLAALGAARGHANMA